MERKRILSYLLLALLTSATFFMTSIKTFAATTQRLQGSDRYGTAIAISSAGWQTSDNVILATGTDFPDALSAAPLAKELNAPILLVGKSLDSTLEAELNRLQVKNVFIVGGEGVVSKDIMEKLQEKNLTVTRLSGNDRYETSLKIANYIVNNFNVGTEIVVATGEGFPDALSIAPIAASKGMPIVLSPKDEIPDSVKKYVTDNKVTKAYVIGGTGVISDKAMEELPSPERISGADRYATNVAVLNRFAADLSFDKTYVATGNDFPDALAGSALAPKTDSPIILVDKTLSISTADYMNLMMPSIKQIGVLGGEGVVPQSVLTDNVYGNTQGNISNFGLVASQDDWIYYNNNTLYKVNTDGTGRTKLSDDVSLYMVVVGDWIYYMNASDQGKLYKMTTDGKYKTKLTDEPALQINVLGDWVYYVTTDGSDVELYKVKTDGTNRTWLYGSSGISFLNVSGDWIYFANASDGGKLYKMKTDGTDETKISDDAPLFINISGDWLYYGIDSQESTIKIKTDGTERQIVN